MSEGLSLGVFKFWQVSQVSACVSRCLRVSGGVYRYVCRYLQVLADVFGCLQVCAAMSGCLHVSAGVCKYLQVSAGV